MMARMTDPVLGFFFLTLIFSMLVCCWPEKSTVAALAQLVEHALHKCMVMGSIPIGGL